MIRTSHALTPASLRGVGARSIRLAVALGAVAALASPARAQRDASEATAVIPALGGAMVTTLVPRDSSVNVQAAVARARNRVYRFDSLAASTDSLADVTRINLAAGRSPVRVSPDIIALIRTADRAWRLSDHRLDPTAAPLAAAVLRREQTGYVPPAAEVDSLRALVGLARVRINPRAGTVFLPRRGMKIDLTTIAVGRGLDLARAEFPASKFAGGVLQVGPSALAFGRAPYGPHWRLVLEPPRTGHMQVGIVTLDSGAVCVVADSIMPQDYARQHLPLVNPATARMPDGLGSVTVIAPRAEFANAAAAALYMLSPERALAVADSAGIAAVLVRRPASGARIGPGDVLLSAEAKRLVDLNPLLRPRSSPRRG